MATKRKQYSVEEKLSIIDELKSSEKSINQYSREKNKSQKETSDSDDSLSKNSDEEQAKNPLGKRRRGFTKHQQTYGVWADEDDESGSGDDSAHFKRGNGKKSTKSKGGPVNFISGDLKREEIPTVVKIEDDGDDDIIQITGFVKKKKVFVQKSSSKGSTMNNSTFRNESFAGIRGAGPSTGESFADWERHTKGIGSKLLYKMGHKHGTGLGREGQGIAEPIKAALRPGRGAIGLYGPEVKGPKIRKDPKDGAAGADSVEEMDEDDEDDDQKPSGSGYQKGQWRKDANRQRPKYRYKTWDEVVNENTSLKKNWNSDNNRQGSVKIIDMTGKEQKVYTDYEAFTHRTKTPIESTDETKSDVRKNFDIPELRYNLDLLVDLTEDTIVRNDRQLRFLKDQNITMNRDKNELRENIDKQEKESEHLKNLLDVLDEFIEKSEVNSISLNDCKILLHNLQENFYTEYKMFGLSDIAVTNVLPLIKKYFAVWQPLQEPDYGLVVMQEWKNILEEAGHWATKSSDLETMDPFHRLLWEGWMPQVRRAALRWEPKNCNEMISFIELWIPILPVWVLENILEQIVLPRLQLEVENWDPTTDRLPIHVWLHPWLPLMGDRLQPVYAPIRHKLSRALAQWHPSDVSAKEILKPWRDVFTAGTMDGFLAQNILPKLEHALSTFEINPADQKLDSWKWVMGWLDMISPIHIANVLIKIFFPKWHQALYLWLNGARANFQEISQWYTGWKSLFPEDLLAFQTIKEQFNHALVMMNNAMSGVRPSLPGMRPGTSVPEHVHQKNLDFLASRALGPSAPANFKDLIDMKAEEHNILFMPVPNKFREGKPVYKFGPCQIYIDRNVVFVFQNNQWQHKSIEELIVIAKSQF